MKNRIIIIMIRSIVKTKYLPKHFAKSSKMTLEEARSGYRYDASSLRVFCCIIYAHIPYAKKKKNDKGEIYIFVGHTNNSKA